MPRGAGRVKTENTEMTENTTAPELDAEGNPVEKPARKYTPRRSPEEKATEEFNAAVGKITKARKRVEKAREEIKRAELDYARIDHYFDYISSDPALPAEVLAEYQATLDGGSPEPEDDSPEPEASPVDEPLNGEDSPVEQVDANGNVI